MNTIDATGSTSSNGIAVTLSLNSNRLRMWLGPNSSVITNTGEGGEDPSRFHKDTNSAIKQVASGTQHLFPRHNLIPE